MYAVPFLMASVLPSKPYREKLAAKEKKKKHENVSVH